MNNYFNTNPRRSKDETSFDPEQIKDPFPSTKIKNYPKTDKHALENYTTWLQKRQEIHGKLGTKLRRDSGSLLMNVGDESNEIKEDKASLEYTRIPQHFDKYRGNPEWWELPPGLHDKCNYRSERIDYFYQKTKVQKNELPSTTKVGLPTRIACEKLIFPRTRNLYTKWLNLEYRQKRIVELSSLLQNIEPHKPTFEKLIVTGKKIIRATGEPQIFPQISRGSTMFKDRKNSVYDSSLRLCLKINDVFFYEHSQSLCTSRKFHVLFEYDVLTSPLQTKYITFENVGRVTIRIHWKQMKKFRLFRDITRFSNTEFFCFDKNELILVPGQIFNFPIWFMTRKVCTVIETWEITTVPKFWTENVRVFFVLQAQTHIDNFMKKIREIKLKINQKVKRRIIKELLDETTEKTKFESFKTIDYVYFEPDLFEASNLDDSGVERKPKYVYDKGIVEKLKEFYSEVRQSYHPRTWDLNVWNLRVLARVKDLIEYAEERTTEFSQYRSMEVKRPTIETDKKIQKISVDSRSKKTTSDPHNLTDHFIHKETHYGILMKLLWKLSSPSIRKNEDRLKYFQVYSILNSYFSLMCNELDNYKPFVVLRPKTSSYNPLESSPRLKFEFFDEVQLIQMKRAIFIDTKARPKPAVLKNVSSQDVQKVHKLYFSPSNSDPALVKDKQKNEKTATKKMTQSKSKTSQLAINQSISQIVEDSSVIPDFDPFADIKITSKRETMTESVSETDQVTESNSSNFECLKVSEKQSLNIYVTIYHYLGLAVDAMVDCIESSKEYRVKHGDLEQLKACFKLFIDDESGDTIESKTINPFNNPDDSAYFEKILTAHLNDVTKEYLICAKTSPIFDGQIATVSWDAASQTDLQERAVSQFSIPKFIPQEISFKEDFAQTVPLTSLPEENLSGYDNDFGIVSTLRVDEKVEGSEEFYYSDDEIFDSDKDVSVIKSPQSSDEEPSKEASMKDKPISLLKEWNKKKCLKNTPSKDCKP